VLRRVSAIAVLVVSMIALIDENTRPQAGAPRLYKAVDPTLAASIEPLRKNSAMPNIVIALA
jgi:hypothetical protein